MRIVYALLLAAAASLAQAAGPTPEQDAMLKRLTPDALRGHLSFLASDLLEGRATPSRGQELAAEYIAAQFRRFGLEPVGDDGYFQTATWGYGKRDMKDFTLSFTVGGQTLQVPAAAVSLEGAAAFSTDGADVVRISTPDAQIAPGSLDGKVVVVDLPADLSDAARTAARRALGTAMRTARPLLRLAFDRKNPNGDGGQAAVLVDPEERHANGGPVPTVVLHARAVIDAIAAASGPVRMSVRIPGPELKPVKLRNVIGVLRGSDPQLRDTYVMLTAHYDHLGLVNGKLHRGANDDASGTAAMMEVAGALASLPQRPRRSIAFMAVFGEELGLKGSQYYGRHPVLPLARTVADINLEQLGRTDDSEGPQVNRVAMTGFDFSDLGPILQEAGKATGIEVFKHPVNSDRYFAFSDNQALADVGVPAHTLSVAYEFPDYHGPADDWQKIDYENMARVSRMVALGMLTLANQTQAPQWNAANPKAARYREAARKLVQP
ncbi:M28 family metallopeptidase [Massilia sp. TS11]|uniref:M28 family metallopeptidase n=1 Tax=Massilia sp. TS11 TaxID=2908003 RepID=UPI001EDB8506|nr:M28 family peptidase [Massilia sp. TS11]MCG2584856.1 M28 family peptidase [Massilia sp. TS11]